MEETSNSRYQGLTDLIEEWLHESGDYDITIWPEIRECILERRFNLKTKERRMEKADFMNIDVNGLWWVYIEREEVLLINREGQQIIKFEDLPDDMMKSIGGHNDGGSNFILTDGDKCCSLKDLI